MKKQIIVFLILTSVFFLAIEYKEAKSESLTYDETQYLKMGILALTENDYNVDPLASPFIAQLAVLPLSLSNKTTIDQYLTDNNYIYARMTISFLSLILAFLIFSFCLNFFDLATASLSLLFYLFSPMILSHSHYITADIGFTLFFFMSYWLGLVFLKKPKNKLAIILGITIGLLLAVKINALLFFVFCFFPLSFIFFKKSLPGLKKYAKIILLFSFISLWFTYQFSFSSLGGFTKGGARQSNVINNYLLALNPQLSNLFIKVMEISLPLGDYFRTLKNTFVYSLTPKTSFFAGEMRTFPGRYYLPLFLLKTPLPYLIFIFLSFIFVPKKKNLFLFLPIIIIFLLVTIANLNLRLRYLLPIYPYLAILASHALVSAFKKFSLFKIPLVLIFSWFLISVFICLPHSISYANEISIFFGEPYFLFSDSNIDWGQGLIALKKYVDKNRIGLVKLGYFGTTKPQNYGFKGFQQDDICKDRCMIDTTYPHYSLKEKEITALSITNWQECDWYQTEKYSEDNIMTVVGGSILVFR